jgi:ribonuclease D
MSCKIIGIDVEHYNNSSEEFVCLVQISGMGKTYLIDALKIKREQIREFI